NYLKAVQLPETYLDKPITELSGGEKQRVALVRNLMYMPEVLVLDEVTSSLDAANSGIILSFIRQLNEEQNRTVLWVTHKEQEIRHADRLLEVINGKVEEIIYG